jgi:hypothetical protein
MSLLEPGASFAHLRFPVTRLLPPNPHISLRMRANGAVIYFLRGELTAAPQQRAPVIATDNVTTSANSSSAPHAIRFHFT